MNIKNSYEVNCTEEGIPLVRMHSLQAFSTRQDISLTPRSYVLANIKYSPLELTCYKIMIAKMFCLQGYPLVLDLLLIISTGQRAKNTYQTLTYTGWDAHLRRITSLQDRRI